MLLEPRYQHNFRFPVHTLRAGETVLERWGELAVYEVLLENGFGPERDLFLRYCIYLGPGSGLHLAIPDWMERRKEALRLSGVKPTHPRYQGALDMQDEAVADMRYAWLRAFSPWEMQVCQSLCDALEQDCQKVATPIKKTDELQGEALLREHKLRAELGQTFPARVEAIAAMEARLFMGDDELKRIATERNKPHAEGGSIEAKIMNRKQK